jgi:hypothetical protein
MTKAGYGPVTEIDTHELAWAAGLFDGEGHVSTKSNGGPRNRRISANVGQKDRRVLDRFQAAVGVGKIYQRRSDGLFYWDTAAKDRVHRVMWMLWLWLSPVKREQFERACERYHAWPLTAGGECHN